MVKPSDVADRLRQIATKIDNSTAPKRELVAEDLQEVLTALESPEPPVEQPPAQPPAAEPPAPPAE